MPTSILAAVLIDKGADANVADSTGNHRPLLSGRYAHVGADVEPAIAQAGRQARCRGCREASPAHGANPNVKLKRPIIGRHHTPTGDASLGEGTTPLARAAKSNDLQVMRMLFDAGADPRLTLKDRTTVADDRGGRWRVVGAYAGAIPVTEESSLEAIKLCVEHGVDLNAFNTNGQTAVHNAVSRNAPLVVRYLAENGAKLDMKTSKAARLSTSRWASAPPLRSLAGVAIVAAVAQPSEAMANLLRELMAKNGIRDDCSGELSTRHRSGGPAHSCGAKSPDDIVTRLVQAGCICYCSGWIGNRRRVRYARGLACQPGRRSDRSWDGIYTERARQDVGRFSTAGPAKRATVRTSPEMRSKKCRRSCGMPFSRTGADGRSKTSSSQRLTLDAAR